MATHEAVYLPYLTLDGDTKKPTAAAVTKGYVDQKHKVTFTIYPPAKPPNGRKHTIDGGKSSTSNTVTYYALATTNLSQQSIVFKNVEFETLTEETGWRQHEASLLSTLLVTQKQYAEHQADFKNKFDADGNALDNSALKKLEKSISQLLKQLKSHKSSINSTADRAAGMLKNLMGPYSASLSEIIQNYMHPTSHEVEEWIEDEAPFMKDPTDATKLLFPLVEFDGMVEDGQMLSV